jgi:lipoprotein-anchoring transpeptidase ErfK/SrfK
MQWRLALSFSVLFLFCSAIPYFAQAASSPLLTLEKDGTVIGMFSPEISSVSSLALADLGTDGISEMVVATGYGTPTKIYALRKDGTIIGSFSPYQENFAGGASVSVCDLDHDGVNEIITGAGFSGGPHVRIFHHDGTPTGTHFFAYDEAFRGGVNILCTDITGDGNADIITTPGPTGGPHVKVFSSTGTLVDELSLDGFPRNSGLTPYALPHDPKTIYVVPSAYSTPLVGTLGFAHDTLSLFSSEQKGEEMTPPLSLTSYDGSTLSVSHSTVSAAAWSEGSFYRLSAVPTTALASDTSPKYIHVDISTQTLTAYEYGIPAFSFLVSTGVATHPTPLGKTEVIAKLPSHDYVWYYGANNPSNYNIPNVLWNMRFRKHYYIHSAYWHNNFGHRMSHGCVNVSIPNAEKIFHWAEVGTPVEITDSTFAL